LRTSSSPALANSKRDLATIVAILAVAGVLAAEVARLTVATAFAETRPALAESLAPRLPELLVTKAMAQVGEAAAQGQNPPQSAMELLGRLARVAPLEAEPMLVQAAIAQKAGDLERAEQLLLEARRRQPRAAAARYLLAHLWLGQGRIEDSLGEVAVLSRLMPESSEQLGPALSEYAKTPGASPKLKEMLATNPKLMPPLLNALATDPDNLPLILELESAVTTTQQEAPQWQARVLDALVGRGDYERAYALWQRLSGYGGRRQLLFNGGFSPLAAPPPFNWKLQSGRAGISELGDGRMRVLYYGRANAILASQLLLLPPGRYRFSFGLSGAPQPASLVWMLSCLRGKGSLMRLDLSPSAPRQADFIVPPAGCEAQMLALKGQVQDMPKQSDVLIGPAAIQRTAG